MFSMTQSVTDYFKELLQSLQFRFIFPSVILIYVSVDLIPSLSIDNFNQLVGSFIIVVILSYLLNALNGFIIRLAEGYEFEGDIIFYVLEGFEKKEFNALTKEIKEIKAIIRRLDSIKDNMELKGLLDDKFKLKLHELKNKYSNRYSFLNQRLQMRFPPGEKLMPTSFGNTIAAFEHYPSSRYGIDAVFLWPRMVHILEKNNFMKFVHDEKTTLDFLINTSLAFLIIFLESIFCLFFYDFEKSNIIFSFFCLSIFYFMFYAATQAARDWGVMVCSAFDLFRDDLRISLNIKPLPDEDIESEKLVWKKVSQFIIYGDTSGFNGFTYPKKEEKNHEPTPSR